MVNIREITVGWQMTNSPGGTSVFHALEDDSATLQCDFLSDALETVQEMLSTSTIWTIAEEGRVFDDATGTLTGSWNSATPHAGGGENAGQPVANSTQALVRFQTGTIRDGRLVRGRVFIPGVSVAGMTGGELSSANVSILGAAFTTLFDNGQFGVWSRPRPANPSATPPVTARDGLFVLATGATGWNEMAVQRRRR